MSIIRISLAGATMLGLLSYVAVTSEQEQTSQIAEKYQLSIPETEMMTRCEAAMVKHNIVFADGASQTSGCGCIISKVSPKLSPRMMTMATGILPVLFEARNHDNDFKYTLLEAGVKRLQVDTRLNEEKTNKVLNRLFDAVAFCGKDSAI